MFLVILHKKTVSILNPKNTVLYKSQSRIVRVCYECWKSGCNNVNFLCCQFCMFGYCFIGFETWRVLQYVKNSQLVLLAPEKIGF